MIKFVVDQDGLILKYSSEIRGSHWTWEELRPMDKLRSVGCSRWSAETLVEEPGEDQDIEEFEYQFRFAKRDDAYYRIEGRVFGISNDVLLR